MLSFQADLVIPDPPLTEHVVGVDIGLEYFLSTADGLQVERPKCFVDWQRKLKLLQRKLKRKQIGSANGQKAEVKVARLHERIANTRKSFHFKQAHKRCDQADVIVVEQLNLIGLSRGMLGKHMLDAGHGQFLNSVLPWVTFKRGKGVAAEDARGSSQKCPDCGAQVKKNLSDRWHHCSWGCSIPHDVASGIVLQNRLLEHRRADGVENVPGDGLAGSALHSSQGSANGESPAIREALAG